MPGILQEDNGNKSTMRVMCVSSFVVAVALAGATLWFSSTSQFFDVSTGIYFGTAFLVGAFAPKALQKFAEEKVPLKIG